MLTLQQRTHEKLSLNETSMLYFLEVLFIWYLKIKLIVNYLVMNIFVVFFTYYVIIFAILIIRVDFKFVLVLVITF